MQTIVELFEFQRACKTIGVSEDFVDELKVTLAKHPDAGIELGSGLYKMRFARKGQGKSGGYRVVYFFKGEDMPIFLISIFAKNKKVNLTKTESTVFRHLCSEIENGYRNRT